MAKATLLGGRYELGATLGVGGMAEVYRGRDTRLGRDVAVKILRTELAADPTFIARFRREAQAAASLNHPHIVAVYDTGEDGGVPYIVMEYVEGKTLRDVLRTEGRMLPHRALETVADVCSALEYSHVAGIVHRDIKPANVMLTSNGTVKVMDFGIARATTSNTMTQTAAVLGTAQYLSPEQARGEHVDARSDVYSTGCLLYELLTHTPPFSGDSPVAVAYQHVREDPELPSRRAPGLDASLDAVVLKAMAKNPGNRYQTASEFRDDLLRAVAGRPVAATPILSQDDATSLLMPDSTTMLPAAGREPQRIGRGAGYGLLVLAVLLVFTAAAILARSLTSTGDSDVVQMPDLVGKTERQARDLLEAQGLEVGSVEKQAVDPSLRQKQPAGTVIDQDPLGRVKVRAGAKVKIVVSTGVRRVRVPSVVGTLLNDARGQLADLQLQISRVDMVDGQKREGEVLVINPPPGTEVDAGSKVIVAVSTGKVAVPDVVGLDEQTATDQLSQAGFTVKVQKEVRTDQPAGTVVRTGPAAKAKAPYGSEVIIVVAEAPAEPSPSPEPSFEPFPSDTPSPDPSSSPTP